MGKIPWRRKWQPIPVFLLGKFHGQRSLRGYHPWGCTESYTTERLTTTTCWHGLFPHLIFSPEGWQQLHFTVKMRSAAQKSKDRTKDFQAIKCKSRFKSNSPYASFHNEGSWILHDFLSSIRFYLESGKSSSQGCTFSERVSRRGQTNLSYLTAAHGGKVTTKKGERGLSYRTNCIRGAGKVPGTENPTKRYHVRRHYDCVGFPGGAVVKNLPANARDTGDAGLIPGLGRSPGEGNGNPL